MVNLGEKTDRKTLKASTISYPLPWPLAMTQDCNNSERISNTLQMLIQHRGFGFLFHSQTKMSKRQRSILSLESADPSFRLRKIQRGLGRNHTGVKLSNECKSAHGSPAMLTAGVHAIRPAYVQNQHMCLKCLPFPKGNRRRAHRVTVSSTRTTHSPTKH